MDKDPRWRFGLVWGAAEAVMDGPSLALRVSEASFITGGLPAVSRALSLTLRVTG